jgi:hypothetical protein
MVTFASGLQAYNELARYRDLVRKLGLTDALSAAIDMNRANNDLGNILPRISFSPRPRIIWDYPNKIKNTFAANKRYRRAVAAIGEADLTEFEKNDTKALAMKAGYWTLIMLGALVVFLGACIGIVQDLLSN